MLTRPTPRRGFTLIELLAVIGIIAILTALSVAAAGRFRAVQQDRVTNDTLSKLNRALDQQWQAVLDEAAKTVPATVVTFCDNDRDRAKALWTYAHLRREFPQTFVEARIDATPTGVAFPELKARASFGTLPPGGDGLSEPEQAAHLLYLIASESAHRGMVFSSDDATAGAQMELTGTSQTRYKVFRDAWGGPITFVRFAQGGNAGELNRAPYTNTRAAVTRQTQDPLDPLGKLANWTNAVNRNTAIAALNNGLPATSPYRFTFDGQNKLVTVISPGRNLNKNTNPPTTVSGRNQPEPYWDVTHADGLYGGDNFVGYRLNRQGNKE